MRTRFLVSLALALWSLQVFALPRSYHNYNSLAAELKQIATEHPDLARVASIGKSVQGRDLLLITVTDRRTGSPESKPGLFIVGNLEGNHVVGSEIALGIVKALVDGYSSVDSIRQLLQKRTFYILPRANPDAAERMFAEVRWEQRENMMPWDDDFDDTPDEDGPEDLNGDGWITQMRVPDPNGEYTVDPQDNRLLKKIDRSKGESGQYKLYIEGIDNDGDEQYNEDGPGGVDLDRNFPHAYPYHQHGAGQYQLQAPEARAIVDFLLAHRNVGATLAFCLYENLLSTPGSRQRPTESRPSTGASREDFRRRFQRKPATTIHEQDQPYFQHVSEVFKKILGVQGQTLISSPQPKGTFFQWAYFQYGVPSFATVGWYPILEERKPGKPDTSRAAIGQERESRLFRAKGPQMQRAVPSNQKQSKDAQWLKWFEQHTGGVGFVSWEKVKHPQLGEVEVGGFLPFARNNPPDSLLQSLIQKHTRFCAQLAAWLPEIEFAKVELENLGKDVYRLTVGVRNKGYFPTRLAHAVRARAVKPTRIEIETKAQLLSGRKIAFLQPVPGSGGSQEAEWILHGQKGQEVKISVVSEKAGTLNRVIKL